jgi:hypothetical protein
MKIPRKTMKRDCQALFVYLHSFTAMECIGPCCDNCDDALIATFFPPQTAAELRIQLYAAPAQTSQPKPRPRRKVDRPELHCALYEWRSRAYAAHPYSSVNIPDFILSYHDLQTLSSAASVLVNSTANIATLLDKPDDWAERYAEDICNIILSFDCRHAE